MRIKKQIKLSDGKTELTWLDFSVLSAFALIGFLFFSHPDIVGTAERSFLLINGDPLHFYRNALAEGGGANYLPTTFLLFAIWNLPLKLLGVVPTTLYASPVAQILWYKMLPMLAYAASCGLVYRIVRRLTDDAVTAKTVLYCFAGFPLAFFSQFIFFQYDIFTVFFMLLGIECYFGEWDRKNKLLFCLYFALAASCKYYTVLIFAIFAVLREKRFFRLVLYALGGISVSALETLLYGLTDSAAFFKQVVQFDVLGNVNGFEVVVGNRSISLMIVFYCVLLAWAYFTEPRDRDELLDYTLYFSCGACFIFFMCTSWHPQWLLFGTFFWAFSTCRNKYSRTLFLIEGIWGILFVTFVVNQWYRWVDQYLLLGGVLRSTLQGKMIEMSTSMARFYRMNQMLVGIDYSLLTALMAIEFFFKHPKFCVKRQTLDLPALRLRTIAGILAFMLPAFLCLPSMLSQPDRLWSSTSDINASSAASYVALSAGDSVSQPITVKGGVVTRLLLDTTVKGGSLQDGTALSVTICDADGKTVRGTAAVSADAIPNGNYTVCEFKDLPLAAGEYLVTVSRTDDNAGDEVRLMTCATQTQLFYRQEGQPGQGRQLIMTLGGQKSTS